VVLPSSKDRTLIAGPSERSASSSQPRTPGILKTSFPTFASGLLAALVCVIVPTFLIALHVHYNPGFSPIDEVKHYDYVNRMAEWSVPRLGQTLLPETLHELSCNGTEYSYRGLPRCVGKPGVKAYPGDIFQAEAQQPPTYYLLTVPLRWFGHHIMRMSDLTAARSAGALWVSLGLLLLWMAGRVMSLAVKRLIPAMLLLACSPVVIYQASIVSNDAPSIFAGSLIALLGAVAWTRTKRWTTVPYFVAGFFVTSLKSVDALAPLIVSGMLAVLWWTTLAASGELKRRRFRPWFTAWSRNGGALMLGAILSAAVWAVVNNRLNLINPRVIPSFAALRTTHLTVSLTLHEALSMLDPLSSADSFSPFRANSNVLAIASPLSANLQVVTGTFLQYLGIAGGLSGFFVTPRRWNHWLGLFSIAGLYLGGIAVTAALWHTFDINPSIPGRYGLAVAPLLILAIVANARGRWVMNSFMAFSVSLFGLTIFYSLSI
jgi:hypothetical protein